MTELGNGRLPLPPPPWIVGHRGAAGVALENTFGAIAAAVSSGVDMLEVDVQLAADGVPVLFHDWDLRRLAGRGEIVERTLSTDLLGIEIPDPFGSAVQTIAVLEAVLDAVPADLPVNLEIKRRLHEPDGVADVLARMLDGARPLLISSFDWGLLAEIRRRMPEIAVAPLGRYRGDELLAAARDLAAFAVAAHHELAGDLAGRSGLPILAYTVNDPLQAVALFDRGVAGVFTDLPGRMRAGLPQR